MKNITFTTLFHYFVSAVRDIRLELQLLNLLRYRVIYEVICRHKLFHIRNVLFFTYYFIRVYMLLYEFYTR